MCGIAGYFHTRDPRPAEPPVLQAMIESLRHRGPDEFGTHLGDGVALANSRLSIIDLAGGSQPLYSEDRRVCVVLNGEIFNYVELRDELLRQGHVFATRSDTEVLVHLYEQVGLDFVQRLIGQFALALWDGRRRELVLARDRVGIRPLFYSLRPDGTLLFASEMKALFRYPGMTAEIDPQGVDQIFTLWANIPPRTPFRQVLELPPGHLLVADRIGNLRRRQYWKLQFPDAADYGDRPLNHYVDRLRELVEDAVTLRLRADVPVAAYLSGGIDSSIITAITRRRHVNDLHTFSVTFRDAAFDERDYQQLMAGFLQTRHHSVEATAEAIGDHFSDTVWFAEKPLLRTAPTPLFLLSGLVRRHGIKVVLTGEGADEVFGGYDIFKEDRIRRFWAESPGSALRPRLLSVIHPHIAGEARAGTFWQAFFRRGLADTDDPFYSHRIRWANTSRCKRFFSEPFRRQFDEERIYADLREAIDPDILRWHPLCRAQYLEIVLFMSGYLLSSQGDRMMMGHSVEGRFPFLDHRVIEFAATIPPRYKMRGLNEKFILKRAYAGMLPPAVVQRVKKPYRAPIHSCFTSATGSEAAAALQPEAIRRAGCFDPAAVNRLRASFAGENPNRSERDDMALVGIASLQLLHQRFGASVRF